MKTIIEILKDHWKYRGQLFKLAKADLIKTYKGAALGGAWAIIHPTVTILVFWVAFSIGLRQGGDKDGYPFFLWLIAGMIPWFYMRNMIPGGASSIRRYSYLVTKIKFPISTIPTFVSMSFFVVHMGLVVLMVLVFLAFGYPPDIYLLQLPFYMIFAWLFFTAWGLFSGMLAVMSRDFLNLVKATVNVFFWLSGIMYDARTIDIHWVHVILSFNPITFITNGYRNCFVYKIWFWEEPTTFRNFIIVYVIMIILATWAYKRLRKDVPDVL